MSKRPPPYRLTQETVSEYANQRSLNKVLTMDIAPAGKVSRDGVVWFSIDMSNSHDAVPAIRQGRGICAGVPDVLFLYQGRAFWCELKSRDGSLSDPQRSMAATLLLSGCRIAVATDVDGVLRALDEWGVPRKRMFKVAA